MLIYQYAQYGFMKGISSANDLADTIETVKQNIWTTVSFNN